MKAGQPKVLNDKYEHFLFQRYSENSRATTNKEIEEFTNQFKGRRIPKTVVQDFMVNDCTLTIKKASSLKKIDASFKLTESLTKTDIDLQNNFVFVDNFGSRINLDCTVA